MQNVRIYLEDFSLKIITILSENFSSLPEFNFIRLKLEILSAEFSCESLHRMH